MQILDVAGYVATFLMGIVLGLLGAGGSILTVPILVYLFKVPALLATSYSLGVVGVVSLFGLRSYWIRQSISLKTAITFFIPSFLSVIIFRQFILPKIPAEILLFQWSISKNFLVLVTFSLVMIFAAKAMLFPSQKKLASESHNNSKNFIQLTFQALFVGSITGFVGSGGGFLIVPVLNQVAKLPMNLAMGTSLLIITLNSLLGFFLDYFSAHTPIEPNFLASLVILPIFGILIGAKLNQRLSGPALKKVFGVFVLICGFGIFLQQVLS